MNKVLILLIVSVVTHFSCRHTKNVVNSTEPSTFKCSMDSSYKRYSIKSGILKYNIYKLSQSKRSKLGEAVIIFDDFGANETSNYFYGDKTESVYKTDSVQRDLLATSIIWQQRNCDLPHEFYTFNKKTKLKCKKHGEFPLFYTLKEYKGYTVERYIERGVDYVSDVLIYNGIVFRIKMNDILYEMESFDS